MVIRCSCACCIGVRCVSIAAQKSISLMRPLPLRSSTEPQTPRTCDMLMPAFNSEHPSQNSVWEMNPSLFLSNALKAARVFTAALDTAMRIWSRSAKNALEEPTVEKSMRGA